MLRQFRKDSGFWDIALVAIILNAMLQISCCLGPAHAVGALALDDPAAWCSIDKADAAVSASSDNTDPHTDDCSDCRQCTGLGTVTLADGPTTAYLVAARSTPDVERAFAAVLPRILRPYEGRAPPKTLLI